MNETIDMDSEDEFSERHQWRDALEENGLTSEEHRKYSNLWYS